MAPAETAQGVQGESHSGEGTTETAQGVQGESSPAKH